MTKQRTGGQRVAPPYALVCAVLVPGQPRTASTPPTEPALEGGAACHGIGVAKTDKLPVLHATPVAKRRGLPVRRRVNGAVVDAC